MAPHHTNPEPDNLLLFIPHVPRRAHARSWDPTRQRAFIAALARTGVVRAAAESVGMSARSAYQLRARVALTAHGLGDVEMAPATAKALGPSYTYSFAAAWDRALRRGLELQMDAALPVALEGERVPVVRRGKIIGWHRKHNSRLALAALGAFRRYNEGPSFDCDHRTAVRTQYFAESIDAMFRLGPVAWPDLPRATPEERAARRAAKRREERIYGERSAGLLDPDGPADAPPRTLAQRGEPSAAERRRERRVYGARHGGMLDPYGPAGHPPRTLAQRAAEERAAATANCPGATLSSTKRGKSAKPRTVAGAEPPPCPTRIRVPGAPPLDGLPPCP